MTANQIIARISFLDTEIANATKANLQGGNGITMKNWVEYRMSLLKEKEMLLKQLEDMGYDLDGNGDAVPSVGVARATGVVRHGRL